MIIAPTEIPHFPTNGRYVCPSAEFYYYTAAGVPGIVHGSSPIIKPIFGGANMRIMHWGTVHRIDSRIKFYFVTQLGSVAVVAAVWTV